MKQENISLVISIGEGRIANLRFFIFLTEGLALCEKRQRMWFEQKRTIVETINGQYKHKREGWLNVNFHGIIFYNLS